MSVRGRRLPPVILLLGTFACRILGITMLAAVVGAPRRGRLAERSDSGGFYAIAAMLGTGVVSPPLGALAGRAERAHR